MPSDGGSGVDPSRLPSDPTLSKRIAPFVEQTTHHVDPSTDPSASSSHGPASVERVGVKAVTEVPSNDADQWSKPDGGDS